MDELFKTVLILSISGFILTAVLLVLKPVTSKKLPAKWQYYVWIAVMLSMVIPIHKLIPEKEVKKIPAVSQVISAQQQTEPSTKTQNNPTVIKNTITLDDRLSVNFRFIAFIWLAGAVIFLIFVISSYIIFLLRSGKNSINILENDVLSDAKQQLKIKRKIRLKMSPYTVSPMLVGTLFPIIYLPCKNISREMLYMIFLHELTHYKRKDLFFKWFSVLVNAVHWFNPLAYILCANLSEACEISCDMKITENMNENEQKLYMKTILDLVEEREGV